MSARRACKQRRAVRGRTKGIQMVVPRWQRATCSPLCPKPGEPQRAAGARRCTRHLHRAVCVFQVEHGRRLEGGQGEWAGGQGDPNNTPMPSRRVGGGRGVGARESRGQGDSSPWRRPLAFAKRATQVPSARARGPRVDTRGPGAMGTDASWYPHGEHSQVLSRMPYKWHVRFSTGRVRKREKDRALRLPNCLAPAFGSG